MKSSLASARPEAAMPGAATRMPSVGAMPAVPPVPEHDATTTWGERFVGELRRQPWRLGSAMVISVVALVALSVTARSAAVPSAASVGHDPHTRPSTPVVSPPPGDRAGYEKLARQAAAEVCPGLPPPVLTAIAEVESGLGIRAVTSSRGAEGPMQFLPATWDAYGADGNGDGRADIHHPVDAVYTAARYLCANGGADRQRLGGAIWNYNRSQTYVARVLRGAGLG